MRAWLDANATRKSDDKQSFRARNDDPNLLKKAKEWQAKKAAAGYARITWPKEYGGLGGTPIHAGDLPAGRGELPGAARLLRHRPRHVHPDLMAYATPEQLARYVKPALLGEEIWCQLFSEPAAGSDVAGFRTRAERKATATTG